MPEDSIAFLRRCHLHFNLHRICLAVTACFRRKLMNVRIRSLSSRGRGWILRRGSMLIFAPTVCYYAGPDTGVQTCRCSRFHPSRAFASDMGCGSGDRCFGVGEQRPLSPICGTTGSLVDPYPFGAFYVREVSTFPSRAPGQGLGGLQPIESGPREGFGDSTACPFSECCWLFG